MTGAGINSSIKSGKMVGRKAAEAIAVGDVSEKKLNEFRVEFDKYWGKRIKESRRVLEMIDKFTDDDLDTLAEIMRNDDILALANGESVAATLTEIIKRSPRKLIRIIRAYLR
jgi:digeranylgeranylglycerophospholipid reductase